MHKFINGIISIFSIKLAKSTGHFMLPLCVDGIKNMGRTELPMIQGLQVGAV